jgi:hypothetical protein
MGRRSGFLQVQLAALHRGAMLGKRTDHGSLERKGAAMYARLVSLSGADPEKRENMIRTMQERVIPTLREYDGFAGYIGLHDGENARAKGLILWESKEAAEAAEETLVERREQMAGGVGLTVESAHLYEAPVVALEQVHA